MIDFVPEKLTEAEIQFLKDNKNSSLMLLMHKCCQIVLSNFVYEDRKSVDHSHGVLAFNRGKMKGVEAVHNFLHFYCAEPPKPIEKKKSLLESIKKDP